MLQTKELATLVAAAENIYTQENRGQAMSQERRDLLLWHIKRKYEEEGRDAALTYINNGEVWKDLAGKMGD